MRRRCGGDAAERVGKEVAAKAPPGVIATDGQPSDHRHRNRIGRVAAQVAGSGRTLDRACGNADIGCGPVAIADHVGAGKAALALQSPVPEPLVQNRLAAIEGGKLVLRRERNGCRKPGSRPVRPYAFQAGVLAMSARSFGPGAGGVSSAPTNAA